MRLTFVLPFPQLAKEADVLCQSDKDQQVQHVYKVCSMLQHVQICRRRVVVGLASYQNGKIKSFEVRYKKRVLSFCLTQHHGEGVEGSASFAQL